MVWQELYLRSPMACERCKPDLYMNYLLQLVNTAYYLTQFLNPTQKVKCCPSCPSLCWLLTKGRESYEALALIKVVDSKSAEYEQLILFKEILLIVVSLASLAAVNQSFRVSWSHFPSFFQKKKVKQAGVHVIILQSPNNYCRMFKTSLTNLLPKISVCKLHCITKGDQISTRQNAFHNSISKRSSVSVKNYFYQ